MKNILKFHQFESLDRTTKALRGEVKGWDKMTSDDKTEYLYADDTRLEIEYQKVFSKGATGGFGNNAKLWVFFGMLMIHLKEMKLTNIVKEMKWRVSENENPITLIKELSERIDTNTLGNYYKKEIDNIITLGVHINPYIDDIPGYSY